MKRLNKFLYLIIGFGLAACGNSSTPVEGGVNPQSSSPEPKEEVVAEPAGDPMENKGIGPVKELALGDIDPAMAEEGKTIFTTLCSACHKPDKKYIGPSPKDILDRRTPEWVMNMIINPTEMLAHDPIAKQLLADANGAIMADQNVSEEDARKILEYFRTL